MKIVTPNVGDFVHYVKLVQYIPEVLSGTIIKHFGAANVYRIKDCSGNEIDSCGIFCSFFDSYEDAVNNAIKQMNDTVSRNNEQNAEMLKQTNVLLESIKNQHKPAQEKACEPTEKVQTKRPDDLKKIAKDLIRFMKH